MYKNTFRGGAFIRGGTYRNEDTKSKRYGE